MCASPDFENEKNIFFKEFFPMYKENFENNYVFKGNTSDRVYYKSFFDIDERVIDITNVVIISSDKKYKVSSETEKIENLGIDIKQYLNDCY